MTRKTKADLEVNDPAKATGDFVGGLAGVLAAPNLAAATDQIFKDSETMTHWLSRYAAVDTPKLQGRAFEYLETLKFNEHAALSGSDLRASTTQMTTPTGPVDIEILKGSAGEVVREVQAKSYGDPSAAIRTLGQPKYEGQGRLVPADQEAALRERLEERSTAHLTASQQDDVEKNLMGALKHGSVSSGGTTRGEAEFAASHPEIVAWMFEGTAALREVGVAGAEGALAGGGFGLAFSALNNGYAAASGSKDPQTAIVDTVRASACAAARGGVVGAGARTLAIMGRQHGFTTFASGAGPAAVAATVFQVSHCVYRYSRGEIEGDELWEGAGGAMLRGTTCFYCGLAGQILIPVPVVGAIVGSTVGYVTASILVQSGLLGVGPSNKVAAEKKRREEIESITAASIERMAECRIEIERLISEDAWQFEQVLMPALDNLEGQLVAGTAESAIIALAGINAALGLCVGFRDFTAFDEFMRDPDSTLIL